MFCWLFSSTCIQMLSLLLTYSITSLVSEFSSFYMHSQLTCSKIKESKCSLNLYFSKVLLSFQSKYFKICSSRYIHPKTNQLRNKVHYETIPVIPQTLLCPVLALKNMLAAVPGSKNDPLFTIPRRGCWLPLTDSIVRKHRYRVIKALGWEHHKYTFHTFRRSGASWAHNHNVPIQAIKEQGTWSSDCVYRYLSSYTQFSSSPFFVPFNSTYNLDGCLGEPFFYKMLKQLTFSQFWGI